MGPPLPQFTAGLNLVRDWGSCLGNPSMPTIVLVTYLSQVALTIVLGVVLLHFYRQYRHDYLLQWCRSWWALAVYLGFGVLGGVRFHFSRQHRRGYLREWCRRLWALAVSLGFGVLGVVLLHFYRQYRHDYLLQW